MNTSFMKRTKAAVIILGVVMLLLGLAFFVAPVDAMVFVTLCCGWAFIFGGIATLVGHFRNDPEDRSAWDVVFAILEIVLGVLFLVWTGWATMYLIVFLGCMVFVTGIADIFDAIALRNVEGSGWVLWLILGIITVILGCFMFASPVFLAESVMIIAGVSLVFDGITEIVVGVRM